MLSTKFGNTYPEIRRSGVKVQHHLLRGGTNCDLTQVHGIILLVFCSNRSGVSVVTSLDECRMSTRSATFGGSSLVDGVFVHIGAGLCGLEAKPVHQIDIGFGAMALVLFVVNGLDLLQTQLLAKFGLNSENRFHDGRGLRKKHAKGLCLDDENRQEVEKWRVCRDVLLGRLQDKSEEVDVGKEKKRMCVRGRETC